MNRRKTPSEDRIPSVALAASAGQGALEDLIKVSGERKVGVANRVSETFLRNSRECLVAEAPEKAVAGAAPCHTRDQTSRSIWS